MATRRIRETDKTREAYFADRQKELNRMNGRAQLRKEKAHRVKGIIKERSAKVAPPRNAQNQFKRMSSSGKKGKGGLFSTFMAFIGGILLRAPAIALLRVFAQALMAGPGLFKFVGSGIMLVLGLTAASGDVQKAPDPFGAQGDPANHAPKPRIDLPDDVYKEKEREIPVPRHWKHRSITDVHLYRVPVDPKMRLWNPKQGRKTTLKEYFEASLADTSHANCVGRDGSSKIKGAQVVKIERVENHRLWKAYWHRKREMLEAHKANGVQVKKLPDGALGRAARWLGPGSPLDKEEDSLLEPGLNEHFLFHGTKREYADIIVNHGFDERLASLGGLYGAGVYHASQGCKAAQYAPKQYHTMWDKTPVKTIIVSRVILGDPQRARGSMNNTRRPDENQGKGQGVTYDSVVASSSSFSLLHKQMHNEFIVYDRTQVYPEYVLSVVEK